ncbi:hypothetical protein B0H10DRAFT_1942053 [Mycena sp. CBHHK59/15]|nr:hypothetical protein B0H10DRAFT_1942053 [Mycena sp. CBHHK59/15]
MCGRVASSSRVPKTRNASPFQCQEKPPKQLADALAGHKARDTVRKYAPVCGVSVGYDAVGIPKVYGLACSKLACVSSLVAIDERQRYLSSIEEHASKEGAGRSESWTRRSLEAASEHSQHVLRCVTQRMRARSSALDSQVAGNSERGTDGETDAEADDADARDPDLEPPNPPALSPGSNEVRKMQF